jgi:hypothetical protein
MLQLPSPRVRGEGHTGGNSKLGLVRGRFHKLRLAGSDSRRGPLIPPSPRTRGEGVKGSASLTIRWCSRLQSCRDRFENAVGVGHHVIVPKSEHPIAVFGQPPVANKIALAVGMLAAVHLDNQAPFATDEVDHIGSDRLLTRELEAKGRSRTQSIPEPELGIGGIPAKSPRAVCLCDFGAAHGGKVLSTLAAASLAPRAGRGRHGTWEIPISAR